VKHNAPGAHINPHLKINREDLLLLPPAADYHRLVESRTPSPLLEHPDRLLASGGPVDAAVAAAAATAAAKSSAAAADAGGDQSSIESESEGAAGQPAGAAAESATSGGGDGPTSARPVM